mmetsp:Transcript_102389/g.219104  ORF Transcript_102389/g.219104 Transcript_102389/m.219104 type:complete len:170 (+) Transcript_102389:81-590(+)
MPRIYKPLPPVGKRSKSSTTPRTAMEAAVRDDDPAQEAISAANMFYGGGTHRSPQCKESQRTPGPGAYRTASTFPQSPRDETQGQRIYKRGPTWKLTQRTKGRVADIGNPYVVVPPVVSLYRKHVEGRDDVDYLLGSRVTVNTMPPCGPSSVILKGHSGDVPKGHGLPF